MTSQNLITAKTSFYIYKCSRRIHANLQP